MKDIFETVGKYLDLWLSYRLAVKDFPGISVAISYKKELIYRGALGYADVDKCEKLTPEHLMRVASQSKTFTALAIMQLAEKKKIALDDNAVMYLDFLNPNDAIVQKVTIRQLLSHAAGVNRDMGASGFWNLEESFPDTEKLKSYFKTTCNIIETNKQFKYSNSGFALLGLIIEKVSGQSYAEYVTENIITPCGLKNVYPDYESAVGPYAQGYSTRFPAGKRRSLGYDSLTNVLAPATGFCATPTEMCKLYHFLLSGDDTIISDEAKKEMLKPGFQVDEKDPRRYGYGFIARRHKWFGHGGSYVGFSSGTFFDSEKELIVSVVVTAIDGSAVSVVEGIFNIVNFFLDHKKEILTSSLQEYFIAFQNVWDIKIAVPCGNKIYICDLDGNEPFENAKVLEPVEKDVFKVARCGGFSNFGEIVRFIRDGKGEIVKYQDGSSADVLELKF